MTLNQMENFVTVVEAGSFSQAAEALFLSPQALIQKIGRMEQEIGFKLLIRTSKGVRVSPAGEEYYRSVKRILAEYANGIERAAKKAEAASSLRIGLPEGVAPSFLLAVCRLFSERYPNISLSYKTYSRTDTIKALISGKIDIGAQLRTQEDTPYLSERLFPAAHYCLVPRNSPLAGKAALGLSDLNGYTLGYCGASSSYSELNEQIRAHGLNIQLRSIPDDFSEALLFCMSGNVLLANVPMISYLKGSLQVIPFSLNLGFYYYLSYTQEDNENIQRFIRAAREVAASENHPWRAALSNLPIDK